MHGHEVDVERTGNDFLLKGWHRQGEFARGNRKKHRGAGNQQQGFARREIFVALLLAVFIPSRQMADLSWALIPLWAMAALELARNADVFSEENGKRETQRSLKKALILLERAFRWKGGGRQRDLGHIDCLVAITQENKKEKGKCCHQENFSQKLLLRQKHFTRYFVHYRKKTD